MKQWMRPVFVGLAGVVAVFALMGEGSEDNASSDGDTGEKREASAPAASSGPGTSQASPAPLGTTLEVAKGWEVTVNSANLDADADLKAANQFNTPDPGTRFVLVNVTITNTSDEPATALSNVKLSALPPSGVAIDSYSCLVVAPDQIDPMAQMQPGASVTGNLCFEVKPDEVEATVLLGEPQFTLDKQDDQRFFALT